MYRVLYGGELLHDPRTDSALLGGLQLEQNQNECGYCEFTIYPDHPLHGTLKERDMANQIKVYDDEALLFQGFIYELGRDFQTSGTVKCKGDLSLLECSIVRPYSTLEGEYETTAPNTVDGYFRWLIEQHNEQVEQEKRFSIGMNEGNLLDKNNYIYRESKQLPTTAEEIEEKILNDLGGYIRVRYPDGVRTIDLMAECYDANTQIFDFGVNLMDYQETTDALEMFTALVLQGATPEGYDLPLTVESLEDGVYAKDTGFSKRGDLVYSHSGVERYGWIVGTYENQDIETAEGLLDAGVIALKSCVSPIKTIEVKAVDLSIINKKYKPVQVGEYVRVRSKVHSFDSYMLCTSIAPNLNNPEESLYTLGMTFDSLTGIQNKRINALNATITKNYERTEAISAEAKAAANQAAIAGATAEAAQAQAEAAQAAAGEAKAQAEAAATSAGEATTAANDAQTAANAAAQAAIDADAKAQAAQAAVDAVETTVTIMQTDVANAQSAAEAAQQTAAQADSKAAEAKEAAQSATNAANTAQTAAEAAQTSANSATDKANEAQTKADEAKTAAADASTTAAAAKLDAEQANKDIAALGEELETVSNTMTADYARKTDLTEATASLQSQITQNAGQITSTVTKLTEVDETANDAAEQAAAAQSAASAAQTTADQATADAEAAQAKANEAATAAATAQSNADTANAAAATAQAKADEAAADLATAEANLASVTSRVDSTEEEIAAAQQAVTEAQAAADAAQADATEAATKAANAQTTASNAATAASNAQSAADQAAADAATAQETADTAKGDAAAAKAAADAAAATAAAAQSTADTAKANAATAQSKADQAAAAATAAQTAADEADAKAAQAAADLATAEQNLADVTSRVGATEEEIEAAQAAVETAQAAADQAKADAATAQSTADTAKTNAANAQTAANNAKAAADAAQADADAAKEAADAAQADVDALAVRVTTAETKIEQNSEAITLRATKTEVTQTLGGYYTKEEADAKIKVSADSITQSVSNTYATKTALSATDTKAANAATAASNAQNTANDAADAAEAAQSTADTAKTNAATAQSTANTANSTANTAKANAATAQAAADAAQQAADDAQDDVDALTTRVSTAETKIEQNSDAIALRATKTELTTVSNAASAAQSTADTAKTNAATAQTTANNAATAAANAQADIDGLEIGGRNLLLNTAGTSPVIVAGGQAAPSAAVSYTNADKVLTLNCNTSTNEIYYRFMNPSTSADNLYALEAGGTYTFSGKVKLATTSGSLTYLAFRSQAYRLGGWSGGLNSSILTADADEWVYFEKTFTVEEDATGYYVSFQLYYDSSFVGTVQFTKLKLEKGNKATDWTPAPEDQDAATKAVADNLAANYYTKAQTESEIQASAEAITLSVSSTYATNSKVDGLSVGGRNLIAGTSLDTEYSGNMGSDSYKDVWSAKTIAAPAGTEYVVSFDAKADAAQTIRCFFYSPNTTLTSESSTGDNRSAADGMSLVNITTEWKRYWVKWTQTAASETKSVIVGRTYAADTIYIRAVKLEEGNMPTAWTSAPEDIDAAVANAQATGDAASEVANSLVSEVEGIETTIEELNTHIVQTDESWRLAVSETRESVIAVDGKVDAVQRTVDTYETWFKMDDSGLTIGKTEDGEELPLKVRLDNDSLDFMDNDTVVAYVSNEKLMINAAEVNGSLDVGGFRWTTRDNGNMGLMWIGG